MQFPVIDRKYIPVSLVRGCWNLLTLATALRVFDVPVGRRVRVWRAFREVS